MDPPKCQSCGMPMNSGQFGTNANGSFNNEYCHFCFKDGKFRDEGISMQEKINKSIKISTGIGMPEARARENAKKIFPTLKRWKK